MLPSISIADPDAAPSLPCGASRFPQSKYEYVLQANDSHVWTYMEADDGSLIVLAGYHWVNRIGYFITELPWSDPAAWFVVEGVEPDGEQ